MVSKGWSFDGASMVEEKGRKNQREGEGKASELLAEWGERMWLFSLKGFLFSFFLFLKRVCHMSPFEWSKKGPLFLLMWLILSHKKRKKIWPFEMLKSCLGLRAISLVPVPRVSLHPSGPIFESKQYIHQNAQNETPSVVQRLVLLNFKLHTKW